MLLALPVRLLISNGLIAAATHQAPPRLRGVLVDLQELVHLHAPVAVDVEDLGAKEKWSGGMDRPA